MSRIVDSLIQRLQMAAQSSSNVQRQMMEDKSRRQEGNTEGRTDLYMWPHPHQTLEGQAAILIKDIKETLEEAMRLYPDSHPGLVFLATGSGLLAETPGEVHLSWAKEVMENKKLDQVQD